MKNLIRKILRENTHEDDYQWVSGLDVGEAEKEIQKPWKSIEYEWGGDPLEIYRSMIEHHSTSPEFLKQLGQEIYDLCSTAYDVGKDNGYDDGRSDCDCDGCCDDYVYYDEHRSEVDSAREEGREEGREESQSEIEELRNRISELESQINEGQNKKNIKRI